MTLLGTWNISMRSPFGAQNFLLTFSDDPPRGVMSGSGDKTSEVEDVTFDGDSVTFTQDVTQPMKMHITWALDAEGDELSGTAKAGMFPAQKVSGARADMRGLRS